jgi:hypothetical protein
MIKGVRATTLAICAAMTAGSALAKDGVAAGAFHVERPTLASLGFDWRIAGDDNRTPRSRSPTARRATKPGKPACR